MAAVLKIKDAKSALWHRGYLRWKLSHSQRDVYDLLEAIEKSRHKKGFVRTSRRFGKTFNFLVYGIERCLRRRGTLIPYVAPTLKHIREITVPIVNTIVSDCPLAIRPQFKKQDNVFYFPSTRSKILLGASENGHAEKFRGLAAQKALIDEAGVIRDLRYLVNDILMPTLMFGGDSLLISGTPPPTPDHYYSELAAECEISGTTILKTIWDNDRLRVGEILDFAKEAGCVVDWDRFDREYCEEVYYDSAWAKSLLMEISTTFRREYLAEILIDADWAVIPELTDEKVAEIVVPWARPEFFYPYTVIDTGFIDFTAVTFGYWDFKNAKAVVEDDMLINFREGGMNARTLAHKILAREKELWGLKPTHLRFGDGDLIVLNELSEHGLVINPVAKDHLEAQVNQARVDIVQDVLRINPRAVNTIAHARYAVWNKRRNAFDRTENHGHYDALASLIYFLRHINRYDNPYPPLHGVNTFENFIPEGASTTDGTKALLNIFSR